MSYDYTQRLHDALAAVCPIDGCTLTSFQPSAGATAEQITEANGVLSSFAQTDAAHETWLANRNPDRKGLLDDAQQALADNAAFLALGAANNAQIAAQVRSLTRQCNRIIRRLIQL